MQQHRVSSLFLAAVLVVAATVVSVAGLPAGRAEAARPAPQGPLPNCVVGEFGARGLGCVPDDQLGGAASGTYASGGSFTVTTEPGISPCFTYISTGCYIDLNAPSLVRCVYLANNDPDDVRSCGALSTEGGPSAQRQGVCFGQMGNVYAYGGDARYPEQYWVARSQTYKQCEYEVSDQPIDNLRGPTFWLVKTSVLECVAIFGGWDCTDKNFSVNTYQTVEEYSWLPVEGTLAPHAAFTPNELGPGTFEFENLSEPPPDGAVTWEWTFGDGETSAAPSPVHQYELPGSYDVTLRMKVEGGPTYSETQTLEVEPPELSVSVSNLDARFGPGETGNRYAIGDEFTATIVVTTDTGLGELTDVAPTVELLTLPPQLEVVGDLPTVEPTTFGSNERVEYSVDVRAVAAGRFDLVSTWTATDESAAVAETTGTLPGAVVGLKVEVIVDPENFVVNEDNNDDGDITDEDNDVSVTVKVTNVSQGPITGLSHDGLDLSSNVLDDPEVRLDLQAEPERGFNDLGVGEFDELTWDYRATDAVDARAQILVTGTVDGDETSTSAEADISAVTDLLIRATITRDNQQLVSGQVIRFSGVFENVTDEGDDPRTVTFGVARQFSPGPRAIEQPDDQANGGNGWFTTVGAETGQGIEMFELEPGASIELDSIVYTQEVRETSGFTIAYEVNPFVPEVDGDGNPVVPLKYLPADPRNVEYTDENGASNEHRVLLAGVTPTNDAAEFLNCGEDLGFITYVSCKFTRGISATAYGLWQIGYFVSSTYYQGKIYAYRTAFEFITSDPAARQELVDEVIADLTELKRQGYEALQHISLENLALMVPAAIDRGITRIANAMNTGSVKLVVGEMAEIVGENFDMVFEALVAARVAIKTTLAVGGRAGLVRSAIRNGIEKESKESIEAAFRVIREQGERKLPGSRVMRAGVDVTDYPAIAKAYGASPDDVRNLFKIAEDQGVTIVFRSRSPKSIDLIESGRALPKPQGVKTKGVNDLDMKYLGYPEKYDSVIAIVEPPVGSVDQIDGFLDTIDELATMPNGRAKTDLRNALRERLKTRLKEWNEFEADRAQWTRDPSNRVDGKQGGIKVDFDPEFNQLDRKYIDEVDNVRGRVLEEPDLSDGRKVYRVQMEGPAGTPPGADGTRFRDITGDIDFLAILTPDGRVLGDTTDAARQAIELQKRAKIYEMMQELVGMQHGESFTIPPGKIRNKYMRDGLNSKGGETLLAATPQKRLMTTYFDDSLSTLLGGPNGDVVQLYERSFFEGIFQEVFSPPRTLNLLTVAELTAATDKFKTIGQYFGLSIFATLSGLRPADVKSTFDRMGDNLQPGADGGVVEYTPPPGADGRLELVSAESTAGAAGGRWTDVDAAALVSSGPVGLRPWTYIDGRVGPGDTEVPAVPFEELGVPASSDYFEPGDVVVVDPGGADEEVAVLSSVAPMRFVAPLSNDHEWGTMVLLTGPIDSGSVPLIVPLSPERLVESRAGLDTTDGEQEGIGLREAKSVTEVRVTGRGGVPDDGVGAAVLNVTAVGAPGRGHFRVFPCGDVPTASTLNWSARTNVANEVVAKLSAEGTTCVYAQSEAHLVVDVVGYIEAA